MATIKRLFSRDRGPVSVSKPGGRFCADIVGARISDDYLEIIHVEVGSLSNSVKEDISRLTNKFSAQHEESITRHLKKLLNFKGKTKYKKMYVASYCTPAIVEPAKKAGIDFHKLEDFIITSVLHDINEWKENPPQQSRTKGSKITLPETHWLLKLIDFLNCNGLLKKNISIGESQVL